MRSLQFTSVIFVTAALTSAMSTMTGCSSHTMEGNGALGHETTLLQDPFNANSQMRAGVLSEDASVNLAELDAKLPTENSTADAPSYVTRCHMDKTTVDNEYETAVREMVDSYENPGSGPVKLAVRFALSMGSFDIGADATAELAHQRAFLGDDALTAKDHQAQIPIDDVGQSYSRYANIDTKKLVDDYSTGKRCSYTTTPLVGYTSSTIRMLTDSPVNAPFAAPASKRVYVHANAYLHYGPINTSVPASSSRYLYRGPELNLKLAADTLHEWETHHKDMSLLDYVRTLDNVNWIQTPSVYAADLRPSRAGAIFKSTAFSSLTRGDTGEKKLNELIVPEKFLQGFETFVANHDRSFQVANYTAPKLTGSRQLALNILEQLAFTNASVTAFQYTPIVLDLGEPGLRTSSLNPPHAPSVFFNLAYYGTRSAASSRALAGIETPLESGHKTAWLGSKVTQDAQGRLKAEVEDGILIQYAVQTGTYASGAPKYAPFSALNLVGKYLYRSGGWVSMANGYETLRAFIDDRAKDASAKKSCADYADPRNPTDKEILAHYLTPADPAYAEYKVWIDKNRDGRPGEGEVTSLEASDVVALSVCEMIKKDQEDPWHNGTERRSVFVLANAKYKATIGKDARAKLVLDILKGKEIVDEANWRLALDVYFSTTKETLEGTAPEKIDVIAPPVPRTAVAGKIDDAKAISTSNILVLAPSK